MTTQPPATPSSEQQLQGALTRDTDLVTLLRGLRTRRLPQARVLAEVAAERRHQDEKFGPQNHRDGTGNLEQQKMAQDARSWCKSAFGSGHGTWSDVLAEEVAEVNAERDPALLRLELVQVAAVAVAWIEAIDRRPTLAAPETVPARPRSGAPNPGLLREIVERARAQTPPAPVCGRQAQLADGEHVSCTRPPAHPGVWHGNGRIDWKTVTDIPHRR